MCYVGIGRNKLPSGRPLILETDEDAFAFALARYNLMPIDGLDSIPKPFKQAVIEWEFSGDWVHYDSLEDYEAELAERGEESI